MKASPESESGKRVLFRKTCSGKRVVPIEFPRMLRALPASSSVAVAVHHSAAWEGGGHVGAVTRSAPLPGGDEIGGPAQQSSPHAAAVGAPPHRPKRVLCPTRVLCPKRGL